MAPRELWNFLLVCRRKGLVKFCFSDAKMLSKIQVLIEDVSLFSTPQLDSETEIREDEKERDIVEESFSEQQDIPCEEEHTSSDHPSFPSPYSSFFSDSEPHPPTTPIPSDYDSVKNTSFLSAPISPVLRIQYPETFQDDETREDDISLLSEQLNGSREDAIDQEEQQQENGVISDREPTDDELEVVEESEGDETAALEGDETASLEEECRVVPSPPPLSASAAILLSSDDEDTNLENMLTDLRLQSAKKEVAAKRVVSRKSLDVFIVSDSEELSEEEEEDEGKENQSPQQRPPYMFDDSPLHGRRRYTPATYTPPACSTPAYLYTPKRMPSVATVSTVHTPSATKSVRYNRYKMATELYQLFNQTVFDGKLPKEMEIVWNNRLRTTAGFCSYSGSLNKRTVKIELSTKVCDSYERIRDTIVHEMCHAANWIIDGTKRAGHGKLWKAWAKKANTVHPDINTVDRCHSFEISYKYSYQCTVCDFKIGRHSKSINLETARCPYCANCLELFC